MVRVLQQRRFPWLLLGSLGLLLLLGIAWFLTARSGHLAREPRRVLIIPVTEGNTGLTPAQALATCEMIEDHLEYWGGLAITRGSEWPRPEHRASYQKPGLVLLLKPHRQGNDLRFDQQWITTTGLRQAEAPKTQSSAFQSPKAALDALQPLLPWKIQRDTEGRTLPRDDQAFWDLVEIRQAIDDPDRFQATQQRLQQLRAKLPDCASVDFLEGQLHLFQANRTPSPDATQVQTALQAFLRAHGKAPSHPRIIYDAVRMQVEMGSPREAIQMARDAQKRFPHATAIHGALANAARYVGLLDLALASLDHLSDLTMSPLRPWRLQLARLYAGDLPTFRRSLWLRPGSASNTQVFLHLGRLALMEGQVPEALKQFRLGMETKGTAPYPELCRIHVLRLEGRSEEALKHLGSLSHQRLSVKIPDGETTLNLAELYCLLGRPEQGMEQANRAFAEGFGCLEAYEANPFLAPLRQGLRWETFRAHVTRRLNLVRPTK